MWLPRLYGHKIFLLHTQLPKKIFMYVNSQWIILKILYIVQETQMQEQDVVVGAWEEGGAQNN